MIKIKTKRFPPNGFRAITLWPFIFYKGETNAVVMNHEEIHGAQQKELLILFFYLIYLMEWIFKGYDRISFENEAYANELDSEYLKKRKHFAMWI